MGSFTVQRRDCLLLSNEWMGALILYHNARWTIELSLGT